MQRAGSDVIRHTRSKFQRCVPLAPAPAAGGTLEIRVKLTEIASTLAIIVDRPAERKRGGRRG